MEYLQYNMDKRVKDVSLEVLNLIINGIPSIHSTDVVEEEVNRVLNLIINGIPSIQTNLQKDTG